MRTRHYIAFILLISISGCSRPIASTSTESAPVAEVVETPFEPAHVEVTEATATLNEQNVVQLKVNYKFTTGKPVKYYLAEFAFPGTEHRGQKPIEAWEMKPEGFVKSGIELPEGSKPTEFTVTIAEADSPDRGYTVISNTYSGKVAAKN